MNSDPRTVDEAKTRLRETVSPRRSSGNPHSHHPGQSGVVHALVQTVREHPAAVAAGVFAVVGVLGVSRSIRLARGGVKLAAFALSARKVAEAID